MKTLKLTMLSFFLFLSIQPLYAHGDYTGLFYVILISLILSTSGLASLFQIFTFRGLNADSSKTKKVFHWIWSGLNVLFCLAAIAIVIFLGNVSREPALAIIALSLALGGGFWGILGIKKMKKITA